MSGLFDEKVENVLNSFFLDVDEYAPDELFDENDKFNINKMELRKRAEKTLVILKEFSEYLNREEE
jgi:hypothetical protein